MVIGTKKAIRWLQYRQRGQANFAGLGKFRVSAACVISKSRFGTYLFAEFV